MKFHNQKSSPYSEVLKNFVNHVLVLQLLFCTIKEYNIEQNFLYSVQQTLNRTLHNTAIETLKYTVQIVYNEAGDSNVIYILYIGWQEINATEVLVYNYFKNHKN